MRKCVGLLMVCLLTLGTTANAASTWVSGNVGNWSDATNWAGGVPTGTATGQINNGTCTLDTSQSLGIVLMGGAATDVGVLNINSGANLNIYKSGSSEAFCLGKFAGTTNETVNHSVGTVRVGAVGTANGGTYETRLVTGSTVTTATSTYNLSGSAVLDTDILSKGNKADTGAAFNATGGMLVVRTMIYKFGLNSEGYGFNQGQAKLEIGAINTVAAITVGNSTNSMDYTVGTGGTLDFDIASATSFDTITQYGNIANTAGATLQVDLLGGYTPTVGSTFDVWTFNDKTKAGSGAFGVLPAGWTANWVDTSADGSLDTLRLTYTPEPATITLLGLGLLAIRRNKK